MNELRIKKARFDSRERTALLMVRSPRHGKVAACLIGCNSVMHAAPVSDDDATKAPFFAQHIFEQPCIVRAIRAVHLVVGAHEHHRMRKLDYALKCRQIQLSHCALVSLRVVGKSLVLLRIQREVLDARPHAHGLHALHESRAHLTCE